MRCTLCLAATLGLGALADFHHGPRQLYTVEEVLVLTVLLARLRRIRAVDVVALALTRLAALPLLVEYVLRWMHPGLSDYATGLDALRAGAAYALGEVVLAVVLLAVLDPELRRRIAGVIPGFNRHVVRLAPIAALVALVGWSGHYLATGSPRVVLGYYTLTVTEPYLHACPTGTEFQSPTFPGLGRAAPAMFLGGGYDDRGCAFSFAIAFDKSGGLCYQQVFISGGSGDSGCFTARVDATTPITEFNVEDFGCTTACRREFVGFTGRGVSNILVADKGAPSQVITVQPVSDPRLRARGIAGYVEWTEPESSPEFPTYTGYDARSRILWWADESGRAANRRCGCK